MASLPSVGPGNHYSVERRHRLSPSAIRRKLKFITQHDDPRTAARAIIELRNTSLRQLIKGLEPYYPWYSSPVYRAMAALNTVVTGSSPPVYRYTPELYFEESLLRRQLGKELKIQPASEDIFSLSVVQIMMSRSKFSNDLEMVEDIYDKSHHQLLMLLQGARRAPKSNEVACHGCNVIIPKYSADAKLCFDCASKTSTVVTGVHTEKAKVRKNPVTDPTPVSYEQLMAIPPNQRYKYCLQMDDTRLTSRNHACTVAPARIHQLFQDPGWKETIRMLPAFAMAWNKCFTDFGLPKLTLPTRASKRKPTTLQALIDIYTSQTYVVEEGCELCLKVAYLSDEFLAAVRGLR